MSPCYSILLWSYGRVELASDVFNAGTIRVRSDPLSPLVGTYGLHLLSWFTQSRLTLAVGLRRTGKTPIAIQNTLNQRYARVVKGYYVGYPPVPRQAIRVSSQIHGHKIHQRWFWE